MASLTLYQSYHDATSRARLAPEFEPLDAQRYVGNPYHEFAIMLDLLASPRSPDDAWGLVSSKFGIKTAVKPADFVAFAKRQLANHDVVFINPMIFWEAAVLNVWEQGEMAHPGLTWMAGEATGITGLERMVMKRDSFAYCNYFVARRHFWEAYIDFVKRTVIGKFESGRAGDPVAHALAQPAGHWNNPAANHVPFVIERLFSTFLLRNPHYKSRAYEHPIEVYIRKFGAECGTVIHALSRVKESIADYGDPGHRRWQALRSVVGNNYKHLNLPSLDDPPV